MEEKTVTGNVNGKMMSSEGPSLCVMCYIVCMMPEMLHIPHQGCNSTMESAKYTFTFKSLLLTYYYYDSKKFLTKESPTIAMPIPEINRTAGDD